MCALNFSKLITNFNILASENPELATPLQKEQGLNPRIREYSQDSFLLRTKKLTALFPG